LAKGTRTSRRPKKSQTTRTGERRQSLS